MSLQMNFDHELISEDDEEFIKYKNKRISEILENNADLQEFHSESELIKRAKFDTMIVHFYKKEFLKCKIMDDNLKLVCKKFPDIRFYKIEAGKCSIVNARLSITVLPFLAFFKDGFFVDSLVGFEGLGNENFEPESLESLIRNSNICK